MLDTAGWENDIGGHGQGKEQQPGHCHASMYGNLRFDRKIFRDQMRLDIPTHEHSLEEYHSRVPDI